MRMVTLNAFDHGLQSPHTEGVFGKWVRAFQEEKQRTVLTRIRWRTSAKCFAAPRAFVFIPDVG